MIKTSLLTRYYDVLFLFIYVTDISSDKLLDHILPWLKSFCNEMVVKIVGSFA